MRWQCQPLLDRGGGLATRERLLTVLSRAQLDAEIRGGALVAVFPRVYCRPWDADDRARRRRAALLSVGHPAVLSHVTAVAQHGIPDSATGSAATDEVHLLIPERRRVRHVPGSLAIHRHSGRFPPCVIVRRLPTVDLAAALVQTWPFLDEARARALLIDAVRDRRVDVTALRLATTPPKTRGRRAILALCDLLEAGCESELEIHGLLRVFDVPGLRHGNRQVWVRAGALRYRLDLAFEAEKVAVELDGRTHGGDVGRQRDTRRDAALAAEGWLTVRFTYWRLVNDAVGCRRELLAILARRRQQLAG